MRPHAHLEAHGSGYPAHAFGPWRAVSGATAHIRPISVADRARLGAFVRALSFETRYLRFMAAIKELGPYMVDRFTGIDHRRDAALVATAHEAGAERVIGVTRYALNADGRSADFAIVVADDWQGCGLGRRLLTLLLDTAAARGLLRIGGDVLAINQPMLTFVKALGFVVSPTRDASVLRVERAVDLTAERSTHGCEAPALALIPVARRPARS
jgi:acetyltransferase